MSCSIQKLAQLVYLQLELKELQQACQVFIQQLVEPVPLQVCAA